jgi:hypothetical protein
VPVLHRQPMPFLDVLEVLAQWTDQAIRQYRDPILRALSVADDDLPILELNILDAKPQGFQQAQPATVEQASDETVLAA